MSLSKENNEKNYCNICGRDFPTQSGRYYYFENYYCIECWKQYKWVIDSVDSNSEKKDEV